MSLLNKFGLVLFVALLMTGCANEEAIDNDIQGEEEGSANILERDRELLDVRDDGSNIQVDDGGTKANLDDLDGMGGKEKDHDEPEVNQNQ